MNPDESLKIDEEFCRRKKQEFEQRMPYSTEEVNEFLLKHNPDLHSDIMYYASRNSHPGQIISTIYSAIYIINERDKQLKDSQKGITEKEIDDFWRGL